MLDGGNGWSNPYTAIYENIVADLDAKINAMTAQTNTLIEEQRSVEINATDQYVEQLAPAAWSSLVVQPLDSIGQQLNTTFHQTAMHRIDLLNQSKISQTYSFKS